jgi:hypothetical protein
MKTDTIPPASYTEIVNTAKAELNGDTFTVTLHTPLVPVTVTSCALTLRDITYASTVTSYQQNGIIYVQVTDGDKNTLAGTAETITVQVVDATTADRQALILTETSVNTGIFQGSLPSSTTLGQLPDDGTLYALAGDSLTATYTDPIFGDTCNASASIVVTTTSLTKQLYLSDPSQALNRIDPVATSDSTTATSATLGTGGTPGTYYDQFSAIAYNGSNGTTSWISTPWVEFGDDNNVTSAMVRVNNDGTYCANTQAANDCLRFGRGTATTLVGVGVYRPANLSTASSATLTFSYRRSAGSALDGTKGVKLWVTSNNVGTTCGDANWTNLGTYPLLTAGNDAAQITQSFNMASYLSANTKICFLGYGGIPANNNLIHIDDVQIAYSSGASGTTTATFTQAPAMAGSFSLPASATISANLYLNVVSGSMPASPS